MADNAKETLIKNIFSMIEGDKKDDNPKEFAKMLAEAKRSGINLNEIQSVGGISLPSLLAFTGKTDLMVEAMKHGVKLNGAHANGDSPFVCVRDVPTAKFLLKNGLKVDGRDASGNSAIAYAAQNGNKELYDFLIKNGANPKQKNELGQTLIHQAVLSGNIEIIRDLKKRGVDINARDNDGYTPLDHLINLEYADNETINALKKMGAVTNIGYEYQANCSATLRASSDEYKEQNPKDINQLKFNTTSRMD